MTGCFEAPETPFLGPKTRYIVINKHLLLPLGLSQ